MVHFNYFSWRLNSASLWYSSTRRPTVIGTFGRLTLPALHDLMDAVQTLQELEVLFNVLVVALVWTVAAGWALIVIALVDRVKPLTGWWWWGYCFLSHCNQKNRKFRIYWEYNIINISTYLWEMAVAWIVSQCDYHPQTLVGVVLFARASSAPQGSQGYPSQVVYRDCNKWLLRAKRRRFT